ncbi:hypothetical protein Hanom_Chr10g00950611 [Helianthus anomalus]
MTHGTTSHKYRSRSRTHQMHNSRHMNRIMCPHVLPRLLHPNPLRRHLLVLKLLGIWVAVQTLLP